MNLKNSYSWLKPVYGVDHPEKLLRDVDIGSIDVLALSCYVWNWGLQREIAKHVKSLNPSVLIVIGGPHPTPDSPNFFEQHPYFDVAVKGEGEEAFASILREHLSENPVYDGIAGVYTKNSVGPVMPAKRISVDQISVSPWKTEKAMFDQIRTEIKPLNVAVCAVLETNRGCPYHCTFCDWGGLTYSKVFQFSHERVQADIDWIEYSNIDFLFIADANWGIFERDVEFSKWIGAAKRRTGSPRSLYYSPTKSVGKFLPLIASEFSTAGVSFSATLSIQHMDPRVLQAIKRKNLKIDELRQISASCSKLGVPVWIQLILGCPADSYENWIDGLLELYAQGIHGNVNAFAFSVLPNAPAATDEYRKEWGIKTFRSGIASASARKSREIIPHGEHEFVVGTSTFNENDWIEMWCAFNLYSVMVSFGLVGTAVNKLSNLGLASTQSLLRPLIDSKAFASGSLFAEACEDVRKGIRGFLAGGAYAYDDCPKFLIEGATHNIKWDEWLFSKFVLEIDRFYDEVAQLWQKEISLQPGLDQDLIADVLKFQRNLVADFRYSKSSGRTFSTRYDWLAEELSPGEFHYHLNCKLLGESQPQPITWTGDLSKGDFQRWLADTLRPSFFRYGFNTFSEKKVARTQIESVQLIGESG